MNSLNPEIVGRRFRVERLEFCRTSDRAYGRLLLRTFAPCQRRLGKRDRRRRTRHHSEPLRTTIEV